MIIWPIIYSCMLELEHEDIEERRKEKERTGTNEEEVLIIVSIGLLYCNLAGHCIFGSAWNNGLVTVAHFPWKVGMYIVILEMLHMHKTAY